MENSQLALAEWLGCEPNDIKESGTRGYADYYEYEGREYAVYDSWFDAESEAIDQARDNIEQLGFDSFSDSFKEQIIDEGLINTSWFEQAMHETNEAYASDIKDEGSNEYANRLVEECIDRGVIDESELDENKDYAGNIDDLVYEYAEYLDNEEDDALDWYRTQFGDDNLQQIIEDNDLLDEDKIAERMVQLDGPERYLAVDDQYDEVDYDGVSYFIFCTYE